MPGRKKRLGWIPGRCLNDVIVGPDGLPPVLIESHDVEVGSTLSLEFVSVGPRWRQGVLVLTQGELSCNGQQSRSFELWSDALSGLVAVDVISTEGRVILYNIWDSGRGIQPHESQSHTSGMYVEQLAERSWQYSCTDIGLEPDFSRLVFRISIA